MSKSVSLAYESPSPCCPEKIGGSEMYPYVHLTFPDDAVEIPAEGEITFRFRRTRKTEETSKRGEKCEYSLDLLEMLRVKAASVEQKSAGKEAEESLDGYAKELMGDKED